MVLLGSRGHEWPGNTFEIQGVSTLALSCIRLESPELLRGELLLKQPQLALLKI